MFRAFLRLLPCHLSSVSRVITPSTFYERCNIMEVGDLIALKGKTFSIDTETTGLRWWQDGLIGVGVHCPELGINEYIYTCEYLEVPYGKPKSKLAWLGDYEINPATG